MRVIKLKTKYKVESQSEPGTYYFVDSKERTCNCPEFRFRMKQIGGICKHINAVDEMMKGKQPTVMTKEIRKEKKKHWKGLAKESNKFSEKEKKYDSIAEFVREKGSVPSDVLRREYGELVDDMIRLGELVEEEREIRVPE